MLMTKQPGLTFHEQQMVLLNKILTAWKMTQTSVQLSHSLFFVS